MIKIKFIIKKEEKGRRRRSERVRGGAGDAGRFKTLERLNWRGLISNRGISD